MSLKPLKWNPSEYTQCKNADCVVLENIYTWAPTEGIGFSRREGGSICLIFQSGGGVTIGKYFQRVLVTLKRVTKKKQKFTTTIYLRRYRTRRKLKSYQTYGLMDIANIFCQSLGVPSHAKTFLSVCRFRTDLVSIQKNCHPIERLGISVWKIVIRSNGSGYPFEKEFVDCSSDWSYLFKDKF